MPLLSTKILNDVTVSLTIVQRLLPHLMSVFEEDDGVDVVRVTFKESASINVAQVGVDDLQLLVARSHGELDHLREDRKERRWVIG